MNCSNNKNSPKNFVLIGIIILFIGGYLYTKQPGWLIGGAPLLLLLCCPLMMLMMGCMNKSNKDKGMNGCYNKDDEIELKKTNTSDTKESKKSKE